MQIKLNDRLDSLFETIGLMYVSYHPNAIRAMMEDAMVDFGIEGGEFYTENLKLLDRYVKAFSENSKITDTSRFFFEDDSMELYEILLKLLLGNRQYLHTMEGVSDSEVASALMFSISEKMPKAGERPFQTLTSVVSFLDQNNISDNIKWKLLLIFQQPHKRIAAFVNSVKQNITACELARQKLEKPISKLLEKFSANTSDDLLRFVQNISPQPPVNPSLIIPITMSYVITSGQCYFGLYNYELERIIKTSTTTKNMLLTTLKAISDNSKFEILSSLKTTPRYNQELAQQLGLTPGTATHHMRTLLTCGLVSVEKKDGKVYYKTEPDTIKALLSELEKALL